MFSYLSNYFYQEGFSTHSNNFLFFSFLHGLSNLDEEIGGVNGMGKFVKMDDFKSLNLGFALDEGMQDFVAL